MQRALRVRTSVLPGHMITVPAPELEIGAPVEVIVVTSESCGADSTKVREERAAIINAIIRKYRDVPTSSEAFIARKRADAELER